MSLPDRRRADNPYPGVGVSSPPMDDLVDAYGARQDLRRAANEFSLELDRLVGRLRTLGPARLGNVTERAYELCQLLADLAADLDGRARRVVPRLAAHAAADQVRVLGRDLVDAIAARPAEPAGARAAADLALDAVRALRRGR